MFQRLALIGCGLMGGSLSLAMQRAQLVEHVTGCSNSPDTLAQALHVGALHSTSASVPEAVAQADLIVIAVPVAATGSVLEQIAGNIRADALMMDVGSTKQNVVADAQNALGAQFGQFVPAHPIAGKEVAGIANADADLYRGKQVILTPQPDTKLGFLQQASSLWEALGCQVQTMSPQAHDTTFAAISHLPHMSAFALMHCILHQKDAAGILALAGSGFRDFSRIAASDPRIWRDIFLCNREEILNQTQRFIESLQTFAQAVENNEGEQLQALIAQASQARHQWYMTTKDDNALP